MVRTTLVSLALGSFVLLGCTTQLDSKKLEGSITDGMKAKGVNMTSVSCPGGQNAKEGTTFKCTGTDDQGTPGSFTVTVKDGSGDVDWKLDGKYIDMAKVGDSLEKSLAQGDKKVDVKCPTKSALVKKGNKFSCDVTIDGQPTKVTMTFTDDEGTVDADVT